MQKNSLNNPENILAKVGLSINVELFLKLDNGNPLEKIVMEHEPKATIGGTSYNVYSALKKLSDNSMEYKLIALTGSNPVKDEFNIQTESLRSLLKHFQVSFLDIPILNKSNFTVINVDTVTGKRTVCMNKGDIDDSKKEEAVEKIRSQPGLFQIATGVKEGEAFLIEEGLFHQCEGYNSLNPSMQLIKDKNMFYPLLKKTNLLIMNMSEFNACQLTSPESLHQYGPSAIIVTDGEHGGIFSHERFPISRFDANTKHTNDKHCIYPTGAGDWFHGAFIFWCLRFKKPFTELNYSEFIEAVKFAGEVAGKKITMPGSSNGPNLAELTEFKF